jgi:hypothetical protein
MTQMETILLNNIEFDKNVIFDEIVRQVARQHDVPLMAAAWDSVLEEIELEVESLLMRPTLSGQPSAEVELMIAKWRKLENDARALRTANDWLMAIPMAV